jgi:hypothetical protein
MRFPLREAEIFHLASAFPRRLAPYHSAVRPFSPWSYPMLWLRLSTENNSRRVRRYLPRPSRSSKFNQPGRSGGRRPAPRTTKNGPVACETLGPFRRLLLTVTDRSSCAQMAAAVLVRRLKPGPGDRAVTCMVEFTGQDAANDGLRLVVGHPGERQGLDLHVVVAVRPENRVMRLTA